MSNDDHARRIRLVTSAWRRKAQEMAVLGQWPPGSAVQRAKDAYVEAIRLYADEFEHEHLSSKTKGVTLTADECRQIAADIETFLGWIDAGLPKVIGSVEAIRMEALAQRLEAIE